MKTLIIAEKPSVGRDIAKVLKVSKKAEGYLFSDEYIVSWAVGHLVTLFNPEDYNESLKRWKMDTLPIIPEEIKLKGIASTKKQLTLLKKLMHDSEVDTIICATDSGREGELIFRYIYELVKCKKPVKRLWISSMTDTAIKAGFENLKDSSEYDNLYKSAKCRSEADWLVGINATRAYTLNYDTLLSIGRVQTPTLAIITERQKEIDAFIPEEYWEVKGIFPEHTGLWIDVKENNSKIPTKEKAEEIVAKIKDKIGSIFSIEDETKKQPPGLLYDLTELQRDANKKFGFSAKKTLGITQDLYEKRKAVTYPRTDSRYLSTDMIPKIHKTINILNFEPYTEYVKYLNSLEKLPITGRIVDNAKISDHHAIIPTDMRVNTKNFTLDEKKVYDLVVRKFLQAFYPYYIYNITKVLTEVEGEYFITKGTTIIQLGFMELYKDDNKKADEPVLPPFKKGDEAKVCDAQIAAKKTKPPKTYTEAGLLSAMENAGRFVDDEAIKEHLKECGIGTPATRAAIIERILEVGYIERKGKTLSPTEKGMKLVEVVPQELKSPETTGKWERGLNLIAKGKMDTDKFMNSIKRYVVFIIQESQKGGKKVVFPADARAKKGPKQKGLGACPLCNSGEVYENTKAYYCSNWRNNCRFTIWKNTLEANGVKLTNEMMTNLLRDKQIKGVSLYTGTTHEKAVANIVLDTSRPSLIEIKDMNRIQEDL